jgi:hypothetical protein
MEQIIETQAQITAQIVAQAVTAAATATATAVRETATAAATVKENENNMAITAIEVLKTKMSALENQMAKLDNTFKEIFEKLDEISKGRPTWAVTTIIAFLSSAVVGLLVYSVFK